MTVVESVRLGLRPLLDETRPTCTQTNNVGQITSLTTPQGHMHCRTTTLPTTWLAPKGVGGGVWVERTLSIIDEKWQMAVFLRKGGGGEGGGLMRKWVDGEGCRGGREV